ncbi:MAG: hypothetical protein LBR05_03030 [Azoarcus sp.]|nr:hypothetical protein [Azoarcus sp.]
MRDDFIRVVGAGREYGSWQADEFRSHYHTSKGSYISNTSTGHVMMSSTGPGPNNFTATTNDEGGDETRPVNVALFAGIQI